MDKDKKDYFELLDYGAILQDQACYENKDQYVSLMKNFIDANISN